MRFARKVEFSIKSGQEQEFNKVTEAKILPILQKQKGFQDMLVLIHGLEATGISLWDTRSDAESYENTAYANTLESLKPLIEGTPRVEVCDVPITTLHATV